ncbi:MAG: hypothetical protein L0229_30150 [Blastocatellia bacterium]|nr:hypothetical protein [Blastocatellia bacterium]
MRRLSRAWRINRAQAIIFIAVLSVAAFNGCARLTPKTTALKKIHESYRTDFQQFLQLSVPAPEREPKAPQSTPDQTAFANTLREIRDYRVKYGENSKEAAHLKVLEGMIYLQSGQFGMAKLVAPDVSNAQSSLKSGTGAYTRDQLLAMSFRDLIEGWEEIQKQFDTRAGATGANVEVVQRAADNIKEKLDNLDKDRSKLARPEVDEGAIYLATTAAIFYVWVYQLRSLQEPDSKAQWFGKGQELIGRYLTETEKKAAEGASTTNVPAGRLRYINWYGFLTREASPR